MQIGALRRGIPFAYGANAKRGSDHDSTEAFLGDMLGDKQAQYILQHMVHKYDHPTSKVLAEAYN